MSPVVKFIVAAIGTALMMTFVIGLSYSISVGFAGVSGGLPFTIIVILVLAMALYDLWDETIRKRK